MVEIGEEEIEIESSMDCRGEEEEAEDVKRMRRELIKSITNNWKDVIKMYKNDSRAHKMKLGKSGNTALHMAVASGEEDVVEELVKLINEKSDEPLNVLSIQGGDDGNTPLHLAASLGSIRMCKCIIGSDKHHKQLLGTRNYYNATPMYWAVHQAKKDTFLWLYEMCDSPAQAHVYCHAIRGITVLHIAVANGYWDLAFQIILRLEGLMDSVNDKGNSPLHILAQTPTAFRSGISLGIFEKIIYSCIYVEELVPSSTFKEEKKVAGLGYPNNYQTCINFFQVIWKMINKLPVNGGKRIPKSNKQLDAENPEEGQGHYSRDRAQGHLVFPTIYYRCLNFFGLILSKMVDRSIVVGTSEIRTLKGIKKTHVWSAQIMNKLLAHAVKSEYETNPQNSARIESTCYSEYDVFRRGKAYQTPIISAARNGVIEMVEKILQVFPMTIHDRDKYGRNIVLTAAEFGQSHVYDFLLRRRRYVVDKDLAFYERDIDGNTIMHRAAILGYAQGIIQGANTMLHLQWEVKWYEYVKNTLPPNFYVGQNNAAMTALDIFIETHGELLTQSKAWLNNVCNSCSVIAALIATLAFASSATVPGGVKQDTGKPVLQHHLAFKSFAMSSLVALCSSSMSLLIFFSILMSKQKYKDFSKTLPRNLTLGLTFLFISMAAMLLCFASGHFLILDDHLKYGAVPVYALTFLAVTYFSLRLFPSYFVLLWATFKQLPRPELIHHQHTLM